MPEGCGAIPVKRFAVKQRCMVLEFGDPSAETKACIHQLRKLAPPARQRLEGSASVWEVDLRHAPELRTLLQDVALPSRELVQLESLADRECRRRAA